MTAVAETTPSPGATMPIVQVELRIGGTTCASCAARVKKKLNRLDGVRATVNYATERALVAFPATVTQAELVATVGVTGYTAALPPPRPATTPREFVSTAGAGVRGRVDGHAVVVGRAGLLAAAGMALPDALARAQAEAEADGHSAVAVGWDGHARGVLVVADTVKPTSAQAVRGLRQLGLTPVLLTGDSRAAATAVARAVGIDPGPDTVIAEVLPQDKAAVVRRLQAAGRVVAMVGDGVNDAAALAQADLGLAMGTGTDAAIEASDLTLVRGDLRAAADAIRLARATLATIKGNLFWAFAYNVAALPAAALGLLNPVLAGAAMALSSVFVVGNSLRLRRFAPLPPPVSTPSPVSAASATGARPAEATRPRTARGGARR